MYLFVCLSAGSSNSAEQIITCRMNSSVQELIEKKKVLYLSAFASCLKLIKCSQHAFVLSCVCISCLKVIKRSQRECGAAMRNVITQQRESLQDDIVATFKHFASNVLTKQVGYCVVKKEYLTMNAPEVL